jgi:hypothetical protein
LEEGGEYMSISMVKRATEVKKKRPSQFIIEAAFLIEIFLMIFKTYDFF